MIRVPLAAVLASSLTLTRASAQEELIEQAKRLVVMIDVRFGETRTHGAGIVIGQRAVERDILIATARHLLVRGVAPDAIEVRASDDPELGLAARVVALGDEELDLAFVSVQTLPGLGRAIPWNRLARASGLEFGDGLFTIGQHGGERWQHNAQADAFMDRDGATFRFDSSLVGPAASGGGVFDRRWHVVGMVRGSATAGSRAEALSMDAILDHLREQKVELLQGLGVADLAAPLPLAERIGDNLDPGVGELVIGETTLGAITEKQLDPRSFELLVPGNGRARITAQNLCGTSSEATRLAGVKITDQYGNPLVGIDPRFLQAGAAPASSAPFSVQSGQRYRVEVLPVDATARVDFSLLASFAPVELDNVFEPNETAREAAVLKVGRRVRTHVGYGYDSVDHWVLTPDQTGVMAVQVQNLTPGQTGFAQLASVEVLHAATSVPRPEINQRFLKPGDPAHATAPFTVEAGSSYVVRVAPLDRGHAAPYEITSALQPYPIVDQGEPNNDPAHAYALSVNATMDALLGLGDDVRDCFRVRAPRSGELGIEVTNRNPPQTAFAALGEVRLTDSAGNVVAKIQPRFLQPGSPPSAAKLSVEEGRDYYVQVEPLEAGHIAQYTIRTSLK